MIIEEWFGNDYFGNLIINNYPNLQSLVVGKDSLQNLNSLKICNCEKLKTIEIEDSAFKNVKTVIVESISLIVLLMLISSKSTIIGDWRELF